MSSFDASKTPPLGSQVSVGKQFIPWGLLRLPQVWQWTHLRLRPLCATALSQLQWDQMPQTETSSQALGKVEEERAVRRRFRFQSFLQNGGAEPGPLPIKSYGGSIRGRLIINGMKEVLVCQPSFEMSKRSFFIVNSALSDVWLETRSQILNGVSLQEWDK